MRIMASLLILLWLVPGAFSQQHPHEGASSDRVALIQGLGRMHHPVSTAKPEAQRFFDQGLALSYAFNHEEAARSFKRAAEIDRSLAMAYWGIALVSGPNYNLDVDPKREKIAYEALQEALSLKSGASEAERAYIDALAHRYSITPGFDGKKLNLEYSNAMAALSQKYPDDLDAATLYAESLMDLKPWQLWDGSGKPAEGTLEIVRVLESVLKRDPNHIGANHLLIHAVEASPHPEEALPSAQRLAGLAPAAGHLVHMPAHIYIRVGDYEGAAQSNRDAAAVDEAYIKAGAQGVYPMMYYSHNLHFLSAAAGMQGNFAESFSAAQRLEANVGPHVKEMPMLDYFMCTSTLVRVRFHRWADIRSLPEPDKASLQLANAIWHFARGMAFAQSADAGDVAKAQAELDALKRGREAVSADAPWHKNKGRDVLKVAETMLASKLSATKYDTKTAIDLLKQAATLEDDLIYGEPPDWYIPARESLGGLLLIAKDYVQAESVFREDLKRHAASGRSLFGLYTALKSQGKAAEAAQVYKQYQAAWTKADAPLRLEDL